MSLTPEQLLTPRVLCIGTEEGTPNDTSRFWVSGQIIEFGRNNPNVWFNGVKFKFEDFEKFPHLFRKMPWYEARTAEEQPEYIKRYYDSKTLFYKKEVNGDIMKYKSLHYDNYLLVGLKCCEPSTEAEYLEYQKSK